jgi:hypothetical protein
MPPKYKNNTILIKLISSLLLTDKLKKYRLVFLYTWTLKKKISKVTTKAVLFNFPQLCINLGFFEA